MIYTQDTLIADLREVLPGALVEAHGHKIKIVIKGHPAPIFAAISKTGRRVDIGVGENDPRPRDAKGRTFPPKSRLAGRVAGEVFDGFTRTLPPLADVQALVEGPLGWVAKSVFKTCTSMSMTRDWPKGDDFHAVCQYLRIAS